MKSEEQATPAPATPATPSAPQTPVQTYTATWASTHPVLQQQQQQAQAAQTPQQQTQQQQPAQIPAASPYYQPYTSHYPQAAYATHYQAYAPAVAAQQTTTPARPAVTTPYQTSTYSLSTTTAANTAANAATATSSTGMDTADIATLNDALGSAGVDLRAEEESLQRTHDSHQAYRSYEDRTRKQPPKPAFDTRILGTTMRTIGTNHKVTRIPEESVNYLALALRARLQDLITGMIAASHHRTDTQFDRPASLYEDGSPMWSIVVRSDVAKQLAVLERVEREEEMRVRKERKERAEMTAAHTAALAAQANGMAAQNAEVTDETADGTAKKKRKKDGPGVTARNMSEDVRKKMSNAVATQAAGLGGKYSWMTAASSTPTPKPKTAPVSAAPSPAAATSPATTTTPAATTTTATTTTATTTTTTSSWARPYVSTKKPVGGTKDANVKEEEDTRVTVTMRDAMFVIEKERGHGGGRGAARGWV
ncbi:hypothetical protein CPC08DRAFT_712837 [Agrocybe pediades]|nr:hypothetical protein CPC08DRAFT_712837 [Agrocybe pediades]